MDISFFNGYMLLYDGYIILTIDRLAFTMDKMNLQWISVFSQSNQLVRVPEIASATVKTNLVTQKHF
ncbi:hypothetical protein K7887_02400 [Sutcliffiella horikoshii]|uniref:hypothetical protein n=1 Tax=Sutcliffiella horikoshii TaxID=79883 RepID=UPI001CBA9B4B|nr:hypothetical protein [Sutcliffiella horikoshii]UAL47839.1 hypothetical protein K7887_02400 [Sutcliffiella horikoshii]